MLDPIPWTRYDIYAFVGTINAGAWFLNSMTCDKIVEIIYNNSLDTWGINGISPSFLQHRLIGGNMLCNGLGWLLPTKANIHTFFTHLPYFSLITR